MTEKLIMNFKVRKINKIPKEVIGKSNDLEEEKIWHIHMEDDDGNKMTLEVKGKILNINIGNILQVEKKRTVEKMLKDGVLSFGAKPKKFKYRFGIADYRGKPGLYNYYIYKEPNHPFHDEPFEIGKQDVGYTEAEKLGKKRMDELNKKEVK